MFERYTERARRIIFFGRYEASEVGCEFIEPDFLLVAIARENPEFCMRWLGADYKQLHEHIAELYPRKAKITASTDLPLSNASKRVLAYATEEADRLGDRHIGSEHLFLGLLHEDGTTPKMLKARHEDLKSVRKAISKDPDRHEMKTAKSRFSLEMKIVAEDGSEIAIIPWPGRPPRIGEAIWIPNADGEETTYRILDLCWRTENPLTPGLDGSEFLLTVRQEQL
jgi:ATP-dependent Clp protease ATP-binding subunit ClpC